MESKIQSLINSLKQSVFKGPGDTSPAVRQNLQEKLRNEVHFGESDPCAPPLLNQYVEKIARNAYKIVDQDIENLKAEGFSESEIFELTVAASWGAGLARFEKGLDLLNTIES